MQEKKKQYQVGITMLNLIPDLLAVSGAVAFVNGCRLIYEPAGWLAAGISLIGGAVIWCRGGGIK